MIPVSIITTSLFWIENAGGYFSVHPLPRSALFGRLKSSKNPPLASSTEKYWTLDVPPSEPALNTVTGTEPVTPRSAAGMVAVSWVADTKVVGRSAPFQRTREPGTKPLPLTVSVKPGPPTGAEAGLSPVVVGRGLVEVPSRLVRVKLSYV